jgi:NAD(P)-dependent dehydrogenase (short-subunit alcohol dehydrogenase family)
MKIMIIGATGTIGTAVSNILADGNDIVRVGYRDGDFRVDLGSKASIVALYDAVGPVDAVISTAGLADFGPFASLDDAAFDLALSNKLMGQINLIRIGVNKLNKNGSITLTSGILARQPMPGSSVISMANGALDAFVKAAALEVSNGIRVNTVAPAFVKETMEMMGMDPTPGLSAADTAKAYKQAVEGDANGMTLDAPDYA